MTAAPPPPPWTVTSVVERSYLMARDNFAAFVTISLVFNAIALVVDLIGLGVLGAIVHLACGVVSAICLTWGALQAMAGRKPAWEAMFRQMQGPLFGRLLLLGIIQYVAIGLSAIVVIPPFFLLPLWAVTIPAMMVERLELGAAFSRSADLTRHRRLAILLTFLLVVVILIGGSLVIFLLLGHSALGQLIVWLYGSVAATVLQPLSAIFYVLLVEEKNGASVSQIAAALE